MQGADDLDLSACPSFNSYSSGTKLAEIAANVSDEFQRNFRINEESHDDDADFEFSVVLKSPDESYPFFPIFNGDHEIKDSDNISAIRIPLKDLFSEDKEPPSCSSSEADELETVPPGTYCVWTPKNIESSPNRWCKKSSSTGSASKRWKLRDLLRRSNSEGKDSFVFLTPKNNEKVEASKQKRSSGEVVKVAGKLKSKASAHETFYVRNRAIKEGDKRKSYLPYRPDLVGFFANVGPLGKAFPPF